MGKMNIDAGMPIALTLAPGIYFRCTCGRSQQLPFCDESHQASGSLPIRFEIKERQKVYICSCGKTAQAPYCDGSCGVSLP
jgi:CDGSH iron-sulfur domain-containing protein 3